MIRTLIGSHVEHQFINNQFIISSAPIKPVIVIIFQ